MNKLTTVLLAGALLLLGVAEYLQWSDMQAVKVLLANDQWSTVERRLETTADQTFCYNLVGRRDLYIAYVSEYNEIAALYNEAAANASIDRHMTPMEITSITRSDLAGIIFLGHINPWEDCAAKYKIFRSYDR